MDSGSSLDLLGTVGFQGRSPALLNASMLSQLLGKEGLQECTELKSCQLLWFANSKSNYSALTLDDQTSPNQGIKEDGLYLILLAKL